eukprot:scaffold20620_cov38-Prasinocladus_malaysianus.AAC.1
MTPAQLGTRSNCPFNCIREMNQNSLCRALDRPPVADLAFRGALCAGGPGGPPSSGIRKRGWYQVGEIRDHSHMIAVTEGILLANLMKSETINRSSFTFMLWLIGQF